MNLIGTMAPAVKDLVEMLPGSPAQPGIAVEIGSGEPDFKIDPGLVGTWEVLDVSTSDAMLTLFSLKMKGTFTFTGDGLGHMDIVMGVKGISLDRAALFAWSATADELTMNRDRANESKWERRVNEPDLQEVKIESDGGTRLVLKLRRTRVP